MNAYTICYLFNSPVNMFVGSLPPMKETNVSKAQTKLFVVSVVSSTVANIVVWKWLFTPKKRPNGMLYKFVLYVVSKVMTSPKSA